MRIKLSKSFPSIPAIYDELTYSERRMVREEYERKQKGLCYYCGKPLSAFQLDENQINLSLYPPGFFDYPIHLHHSHITGLTIGAVHAYCNAVLWEHHGE